MWLMVDIPPDIHLLAIRLRNKYGPELRAMNPSFFYKALEEAEEYNGCYIAFWKCHGVSSLFVYRKDRAPTDEEVLPWAQELFEDGQVHRELGQFHMWCVQGDIYTIDSVADMAAKAFADGAARTDSNADAFDFDKTKVGRKLLRSLRNGTH